MDTADLVTIAGVWDFEYRYFAGRTASRFFNALRHEGRIYGTRCPKCSRVLVPARSFCDACFVETEGWIETGPSGRLEIFTIVGAQFPGLPAPPFVMGYVTLDGADTAVLNRIEGIGLTDIDAAARHLMTRPRVAARFAERREGRITDFLFELQAPWPTR
jgi:uncharacterized OB-fold protein